MQDTSENSPARNPIWTRDELILALDLYLATAHSPPGKGSAEVAELSVALNRLGRMLDRRGGNDFRNSNGVYMKLMNYRRFDPAYQAAGKVGLTRGNKEEEMVWNDFARDPEHLRKVAMAIRNAIFASNPELVEAQEEDELTDALEGKLLTRLHRVRERNRSLIDRRKAKALKQHGRLACEGCGFDFEARYGSRGRGFIECHHTKPVHTLSVKGERTTEDDLALLCANCHRMIHASRPWLSVEELRATLKEQIE